MDSEQDWDFKNATEQNGVTTLRFCRKRNTTDEKDVAIEVYKHSHDNNLEAVSNALKKGKTLLPETVKIDEYY